MSPSSTAGARRWLALHRRPVAAGLTFLAVLTALSSVTGAPNQDEASPPGSAQVVASEGELAVPLHLDDAGVAALLRPGDRVDVLATSGRAPAQTVASSVTVSEVPAAGEWGSSEGLVLVIVTPDQAVALATASASSTLSIALHPR